MIVGHDHPSSCRTELPSIRDPGSLVQISLFSTLIPSMPLPVLAHHIVVVMVGVVVVEKLIAIVALHQLDTLICLQFLVESLLSPDALGPRHLPVAGSRHDVAKSDATRLAVPDTATDQGNEYEAKDDGQGNVEFLSVGGPGGRLLLATRRESQKNRGADNGVSLVAGLLGLDQLQRKRSAALPEARHVLAVDPMRPHAPSRVDFRGLEDSLGLTAGGVLVLGLDDDGRIGLGKIGRVPQDWGDASVGGSTSSGLD